LQVERCQKLVGNRPPPVGIKPQQVAVTGNTVEQLEARAAAGIAAAAAPGSASLGR
jgi:hypothetical protein